MAQNSNPHRENFALPRILQSADLERFASDAGSDVSADVPSDIRTDGVVESGADVAPDAAVDVAADMPVVGTDVPVAVDTPIVQPDVPIAVDVVTPVDTYTPPTDAGPASAILPAFDVATDAHVRSLVSLGLARGNRREVVAKIGDSITESQSFLYDCGFGWYDVSAYPELEPTISYFRSVAIGSTNSLNRQSLCATAGWACTDALGGSPSPLTSELDAIHPMWAIVMYGTNDMTRYDVGTYVTELSMVLDVIEAHAVVAVVSTIPARADTEPYISDVPLFNTAIRTLASTRHLPLIDLNVALAPLPNQGVSSDGIHPSAYINPSDSEAGTCILTAAGLQYGYNMRNLTSLQMLTRLRSY